MKNKDSAFWAACRIQRILSHAHEMQKANSIPSLSDLISDQRSLKQCWRMFQKAQRREWTHAADILQRRLIPLIASVHESSRPIRPAQLADVPAIADIVCEIQHLGDEFDEVEFNKREKYIAVTTDEITLEHVRLGTFSIQLHFDRLTKRQDSSAFKIIALDENAATGDSSVTHPHVQAESLCAGDALSPIGHALTQGRVGDAFQLVNRVLHTYNSGSPYVALEDWESRSCSDCGEQTSSDSLCHCQTCERDFCDSCMRTCHSCEQSVCFGCSDQNDNGDCLCSECKKLDDQESEEDDEEEQTPVSDDPIHDPTEDEQQLEPPTETIHEHSIPDHAQPAGAELPSGAADEGEGAIEVDVSPPQAA
jgi:hypothetical protein